MLIRSKDLISYPKRVKHLGEIIELNSGSEEDFNRKEVFQTKNRNFRKRYSRNCWTENL